MKGSLAHYSWVLGGLGVGERARIPPMKHLPLATLIAATQLIACAHNAPLDPAAAAPTPVAEAVVQPDEAPAPAPLKPPTHHLEAFVPIEGACHWAHIDVATGQVVASWPVDATACPRNTKRTRTEDGTQLFSGRLKQTTPLWQLKPGAASLEVLPTIHNLDLAWWEEGSITAVTAYLPADVDPVEHAAAQEAEPATDQDPDENDWKVSCYTHRLEDGAWKLVREQSVQIYETMRGPSCQALFPQWDSTIGDYSEVAFEVYDTESPIDSLPDEKWGILFDLDATKSGGTCGQDCPDGELFQRYAFSVDFFGGNFLTGHIISVGESEWKPVEEVGHYLREFFLYGEHLILCDEGGFGAWDHKTATQVWWQEGRGCPMQKSE